MAQGVILGPVVDRPTAGDIIAEEVIVAVALQLDVDVALVLVTGVIAVFPTPPAVFVVEILRQVEFSTVGC